MGASFIATIILRPHRVLLLSLGCRASFGVQDPFLLRRDHNPCTECKVARQVSRHLERSGQSIQPALKYCICMQEIVEVSLPFTASGLGGACPPAHVQFAI